jgi:hypothetical protein
MVYIYWILYRKGYLLGSLEPYFSKSDWITIRSLILNTLGGNGLENKIYQIIEEGFKKHGIKEE